MAIYCGYLDLVERFGTKELTQLTNMVGPCPAVDSAINDACSEIDGYLAVRYTLPISEPTPLILKRCACELARYFLWDDNTTDHVRQRYEDAVNILKSIASGATVLPVTTFYPEPSAGGVFIVSNDNSVWGRPWQ